MDQELKQKWIEALRSGKYKQGRSRLRTVDNRFYGKYVQGKKSLHSAKNKYCCLGVLCDLYDNSKWGQNALGFRTYHYNNNTGSETLPLGLREELRIKKVDEAELIDMNDRGAPFNEIADYIEEHL